MYSTKRKKRTEISNHSCLPSAYEQNPTTPPLLSQFVQEVFFGPERELFLPDFVVKPPVLLDLKRRHLVQHLRLVEAHLRREEEGIKDILNLRVLAVHCT